MHIEGRSQELNHVAGEGRAMREGSKELRDHGLGNRAVPEAVGLALEGSSTACLCGAPATWAHAWKMKPMSTCSADPVHCQAPADLFQLIGTGDFPELGLSG